MECREINKWNKPYEVLSDEQMVELVRHAIICDYHHCELTNYERSFDPLLDLIYPVKARAAAASNAEPHRTFFYRAANTFRKWKNGSSEGTDNAPKYDLLLGRSMRLNIIQGLIILLLAASIFAYTVTTLIKAAGSQVKSESYPQQVSPDHNFEFKPSRVDLASAVNSTLTRETLPAEFIAPLPPNKVNPPDNSRIGKVFVTGYAVSPNADSAIKTDSTAGDEPTNQPSVLGENEGNVQTGPSDNQQSVKNVGTANFDNENGTVTVKLSDVKQLTLKNPSSHLVFENCGDCINAITNWLEAAGQKPESVLFTKVIFQLIGENTKNTKDVNVSIQKNGIEIIRFNLLKNETGIYSFSLPRGSNGIITVFDAKNNPIVTKPVDSTSDALLSLNIPMDK